MDSPSELLPWFNRNGRKEIEGSSDLGPVVSCLFGWNEVDRSALGVLGAGQRLAKQLAVPHAVVFIGDAPENAVAEASKFADLVHVAQHPLLASYQSEVTLTALTDLCRSLNPQAVLLSNETYCQELVPRLAHRLGGTPGGDALSLDVRDGSVVITRTVFGGKAQATIALRRSPAVIWVRARAQEPPQPLAHTAEVIRPSLDLGPCAQVKLIDRQIEVQEASRLEDARVIVSGGRGLGGPEPFEQLQALASAIGGQMAASRAACDAGWVPAGWQVGQTGKKVSPQLYLAVAISGASQHIMGIADAKTIVAINTDPEAPIFHHCQFGLVGDYRQVVGPLRDKLAELLA
jgi:electron transfer flavoprotein alpha subunit